MTDDARKAAEERYPDIEADPIGTPLSKAKFPTGWSRKLERDAYVNGYEAGQAARTPQSEDEWEAATLIVRDVHNYDGRPKHLALSGSDAGRIAHALLAAGFHRAPQITDEMVDRAVAQLWEPSPWLNSDQNDEQRSEYRRSIRAILEAALGQTNDTKEES